MKRSRWIILAAVALVGLVVILFYAQRGKLPAATGEISEPVAQVKVVPLRHDRIEESVTAYGMVVAAPGDSRTFSVPFECRVRKVFVTGGRVLNPNTQLLEIEPSPETQLQLDHARIELESASNQLKLLEQRLELKLATRQDMLQAEQRLHDAELRVQSMEKRGIGGSRLINADSPGIVSQIAVQAGQIVPAGGVLLETIGENQITVRLGIESEDVAHMHTGQAVRLFPVGLPESSGINGRIRLITRQVNPQTRLVDLFVAPETEGRLLLNEYVEGRIVIALQNALVVPRAAVLPEAGRYVLYTVENNRAVKHTISLGLENKIEVQVIGGGLEEGESVILVGNSQVQDGMTVRMEPNR